MTAREVLDGPSGVPVKTMAEVLSVHGQMDTSSDGERWFVSCMGCSWSQEADDPCTEFAAHQAAALTAAGFGPVRETGVIHVTHDMEAHARSYNEGYDAAITQGLADDPSLADDWLQGKLRDAQAQALRGAADILPNPSDGWGMNQRQWLKDRAATVEGGA